METKLFEVFRNTIRLILNESKYLDIKQQIEKEIGGHYESIKAYRVSLGKIEGWLRDIAGRSLAIDFVEESNWVEKDIKTRFTEGTTPLEKRLKLPKKNLVTPTIDNETYYYAKLADEFLRYKRIQPFLLSTQPTIGFGKRNYSVYDDEILVLESLLTTAFFDDLIPREENAFIHTRVPDSTNPETTTRKVGASVVDYETAIKKTLL
jgi:hypothetical protein